MMKGLSTQVISTWHPEFVAAIRRHYTKSRGAPVGKKMAWRIVFNDVVIGWFGLGEPAFKLAARRRLGIVDARPLPFTVSNFIFRLERDTGPNASHVLKHCLPLFIDEWERRYGWRPLHIETLVDPSEVSSEVPGYCYRRSGFRSLGMTTGRSARRPAGHSHSVRVWSDSTPKLVLYYGPLPRVQPR